MSEIKFTFLIVDDNESNSLLWEMAIKEGLSSEAEIKDPVILNARTGYEAIDIAQKNHIKYFISSWELEPMSGLILMQKIREIYKYKHTHFLIFSKLIREEDLELAYEFNIPDHLLMPFDKPKMIEKMKTMIENEKKLDPTQRTLRKIEDWIQEGKISEALKLIGSCLKPGPHAGKAYTLNGDIWSKTDQVEKAEKNYKQAIEYEPDYIPAQSGLAKLYLKIKKYHEASELFEKLNSRCPKNLSRMINLGNAYLGKGDENKAEKVFGEVLQMDEENSDANEGLGKVAFAKGNMELASKFFKESGKGEELATYFNNMGIAMVNQGKHEEAITLYNNAINVLPTQEKIHLIYFNIGLAYKKQNNFGEASDAFAQSLLLEPTYLKAYQGMAMCVREAKNQKQSFNKEKIQQALEKFKLNSESTKTE